MTTQANVVLPDFTPTNHTFVAAGVSGTGVARWLEKTAAIAAGYFTLTTSAKVSAKVGDPVRYSAKLVMPTVVTETINGVNYLKVSRQSMVSTDVILAPDATSTERNNLMSFWAKMMIVDGAAPMQLGSQVSGLDVIV